MSQISEDVEGSSWNPILDPHVINYSTGKQSLYPSLIIQNICPSMCELSKYCLSFP